jgi:hypothetical protein
MTAVKISFLQFKIWQCNFFSVMQQVFTGTEFVGGQSLCFYSGLQVFQSAKGIPGMAQ